MRLQEVQREISIKRNVRHLGQILEVMVEGWNGARRQWSGRTSQNKVLNFTAPAEVALAPGDYVRARVTATHPNSLLGELVRKE